MFLFTILSSILVIAAVADHKINLTPGGKWNTDVKSHGYPADPPKDFRESWTLTTSKDATIKVHCLDFRFTGPSDDPCQLGGITFDDGVNRIQKCGVQDGVLINSVANTLRIDLLTENGGSGIFDCRAKAVSKEPQNVEVIVLTADEKKKIIFPEQQGFEQTKSWKFKPASNAPIYLRCDLRLERSLDSGECAKDSLTVSDGESTAELCGHKNLNVESSKGEITMTVDLFPQTEGHVDCEAGVEGASAPALEASRFKVEVSARSLKATTCPCGLTKKNLGRMLNGTEAGEGEYPFMVSIRGARPGSKHYCGGSIISPLHILTAAHCASLRKTKSQPVPKEILAVVGAHHLWKDAAHGQTKKLNIKEVHIHPTWFERPGILEGDIAVLVVKQTIEYNDFVGPVCLSPGPLPIVGKHVRTMGWGKTEKDLLSQKLLQADILVLDTNDCNRDERQTCLKNGPSTDCFGDSGGPHVFLDPETDRYTQVSILSFVYGECEGPYFIGTNTVHYYNWIQQVVKATSKYDVCIKAS